MLSTQNNIEDKGIIVLMYHRFEENKYPSTNIQMSVFKDQIEIIQRSGYTFSYPNKHIFKFIFLFFIVILLIETYDKYKL